MTLVEMHRYRDLRRVALLLADAIDERGPYEAFPTQSTRARLAQALLWLQLGEEPDAEGSEALNKAQTFLFEVAWDLDETRPEERNPPPQYTACTHCGEPVRWGEELGSDDEALCPDCFAEFQQ